MMEAKVQQYSFLSEIKRIDAAKESVPIGALPRFFRRVNHRDGYNNQITRLRTRAKAWQST